jgi:misacylated tRNA(Ala) deacylase
LTELLYLNDSYARECDARVSRIDGTKVFVDKTVFYPQGGGQPSDTGKIIRASDGAEFRVEKVLKEQGEAVHYVDKDGLAAGDAVRLVLDWERRHKIMRMHTAAHVLGSVMFERGVQITGNQLGDALTRFDFNVETGLQREALEEGVAKANELLRSAAEVKTFELPREEAMRIPGVVKLADKLPPSIAVLRIVQIGDFDAQADGGTHVKNLREVGQLRIERIENKGAANKRVYFTLSPA